jgi:sugar phosphate isomerase/epimerase
LDDPLSWEDGRSQLVETLDLAADVDAPVVYTLTGRRPSWRWDVAAAAFARAIAPVVEHARSLGIKLALEPTNPLYSDISFVHTVRSGLVLTESCQMFVCLDLYHVWAEADLDATICSGVDRIALVQVSDYFLGDRSMPSRAVPGDGDVPIVEMLSWIDDAGYKGLIDLELSGPRIDVEGDVAAARRGAAFLEACLDRGGSDMSR